MRTLIFLLLIISGLAIAEKAVAQSQHQDVAKVLEAPGSCSLICDWIDAQMKTIKTTKVFNHNHRQSAYTGIAVYESIVRGDKKYRSLAGQLNGYTEPEQLVDISKICWQASANSAFACMLRFFYPYDSIDIIRFDSLENAWVTRLQKDGYSNESILAGTKYGSYIAGRVIEWSKTDGADKVNNAYTAPAGMGMWEPTPPKFSPPVSPYMGNCRTLVKGSIENSIPPPPVPFSTDSMSSFYLMADELYKNSIRMDTLQKSTGLYWDDYPDGRSLTSGGHWATILKNVMEEQQLSLIEGSQLYAALFITTNDAAIGCFKAKYTYNLLRPVTYIRKYMDYPDWNPLITTPSHPEYPAAHATISMSAATILTKLLGDTLSFVDKTYEYRGFRPRTYKNFVEAAREAGMSRFYGGIHYKPSIEAGFEQGKKIADNIAGNLRFKE